MKIYPLYLQNSRDRKRNPEIPKRRFQKGEEEDKQNLRGQTTRK